MPARSKGMTDKEFEYMELVELDHDASAGVHELCPLKTATHILRFCERADE
jgi:hypothetical protein